MSRTQDETSRLPLGAVINEEGLVVIPSNRRPDGSLRKERRIRTGFKPQNEQAAYRTPRQRARNGEVSVQTRMANDEPLLQVNLLQAMEKMSVKDAEDENDQAGSSTSLRCGQIEKKMQSVSLDASSDKLPLGAVRTEEGDVIVPANHRPDGSVRKPVRIRAGYVPQEEQAVYRVPQRQEKTSTTSSRQTLQQMQETNASVTATRASSLAASHKHQQREKQQQQQPLQLPLGVVLGKDGSARIPANKRPDGSMRKEIKIKPGFVPQNEIGAYQAPAKRCIADPKKKEEKSIPGMPPPAPTGRLNPSTHKTKPENSSLAMALKRMEMNQNTTEKIDAMLAQPIRNSIVDDLNTKEALEGELKKVNKKLRQIKFLEKKLASGEIASTDEIRSKLDQAGAWQTSIGIIESKLNSLKASTT